MREKRCVLSRTEYYSPNNQQKKASAQKTIVMSIEKTTTVFLEKMPFKQSEKTFSSQI